MYAARPLSEYIKNPDALSLFPDGPNSGFMVIQDEDSETYSCFGMFKNRTLRNFPFPQNKALTIRYKHGHGEHAHVSLHDVMFIPVLNLPLSENRYYAIKPHGNRKGEAFTCSKDEDMRTCCFCRCVRDIKPKTFDQTNMYQQFEVYEHDAPCVGRGHFYAKSVAPDGYPPCFMRRKGWSVRTKTPKNFQLEEAPGLNASLRARLSFAPSKAVVVGKWYAPFMFVKEGILREQLKNSPFYEVTLEQKWERIFSCHNDGSGEEKSVSVDVTLDQELVNVAGNEAVWDARSVVEGAIWFRSYGKDGEEAEVGLAVELVHRMKWEQERGGWIGGKERLVKVKRSEKFEGNGVWNAFGCYVLVESFVVKRMDGSLALTYDFRHTQHLKTLWE